MFRRVFCKFTLLTALLMSLTFGYGVSVFSATEISTNNSVAVEASSEECEGLQTVTEIAEIILPTGPGFAREESWSVVNLFLLCLIGIISFLLIFEGKLIKRTGSTKAVNSTFIRFASLLPTISAYLIFLFTTNISTSAVLFDMWTPSLLLICLLQCVLVLFTRNGKFNIYSE